MNDEQTPIHIKGAANLPLPSGAGPDILKTERAKATFSVDEMAEYIHGKGNLIRRVFGGQLC